ncbi:MAG TPA: hypothetical protein VK658_26765 [Chryseolinea sp.]|nr:hypothetical protein [Chryseolinea sp.]
MKRFVFHMMFIVLTIVLINFVYLALVGGSFRNYAGKYLRFNRSASFVVLGDSHATRAWAANRESDIYNFAHGSDNIADMRAKVEFISQNKPNNIKALILSVEPHLISTYREIKNNSKFNNIVKNEFVGLSALVWFPLVVDPNTELDSKVYVHALRGKISGHKNASRREFATGTARARFRDQYVDGSASRQLVKEYEELIDYARKQGWRVIALKYPVHPYFDSLIHARPEGQKLSSTMDSLILSRDLQVVDYSSIVNREDLFLDQDHVNEAGSREFLKAVQNQMTANE